MAFEPLPISRRGTMASLKELFVTELRDIYDGEKQIIEALPKLSKKASSAELTESLEHHLEQTRGHVDRLDQIFSALGEEIGRASCRERVEGRVVSVRTNM